MLSSFSVSHFPRYQHREDLSLDWSGERKCERDSQLLRQSSGLRPQSRRLLLSATFWLRAPLSSSPSSPPAPSTLHALTAHSLPHLSPAEVDEKEAFERYVLESSLGQGQARGGAGAGRGKEEDWRSLVDEMGRIGESKRVVRESWQEVEVNTGRLAACCSRRGSPSTRAQGLVGVEDGAN